VAAAVVAGTLIATGPSRSQESREARTPAFGSAVEVVRLDVSVLRRDGSFVTDLGESDFEVYEDGRRQALTTFVHRELPVSLVLLLDASGSISNRLSLSQAAATGFLETLRPEDEASVIEFNDAVTVLQPATSDREALRRAVGRIAAGGTTALYNALYVTLRRLPRTSDDRTLRRRAVLLLSDGEDTGSLVWEEQVIELARRREATIYVIDLRPQNDPRNHSAQLLRLLAEESGGEVHHPDSVRDLDAVYARIGLELRSQYTIGYVSSNATGDGRWRRIEVRVRRGRDLLVRHRTGYYDVP
jgi:Ca-activated chloride channel family protein